MKFTITMKDPDGVYDSITDSLNAELDKIELEEDEKEALLEKKRENIQRLCDTWFEYGEYLTVEIDTEKKTCEVVKMKS